MLTCLADKDYILTGFEKGADEYLTKPFDLEVLKAKIAALLKRRVLSRTPGEEENNSKITNPDMQSSLSLGNITINTKLCRASRGQTIIPLTLLEYELLCFLIKHPDQIWDRQELIAQVWGDCSQDDAVIRKVDVHIGQIRRELGAPESKCIRTIRGKGYVFEPLTDEAVIETSE